MLSLIPLRNRRTTPEGEQLVTRISEGMTEWRCDGQVGYGLSEYLDQIVDGQAGRRRGLTPAASASSVGREHQVERRRRRPVRRSRSAPIMLRASSQRRGPGEEPDHERAHRPTISSTPTAGTATSGHGTSNASEVVDLVRVVEELPEPETRHEEEHRSPTRTTVGIHGRGARPTGCAAAARSDRSCPVSAADASGCTDLMTAGRRRMTARPYQEPPPPPPPPPPEKPPPPLKPLDPEVDGGVEVSVPAVVIVKPVDRAREHHVLERRRRAVPVRRVGRLAGEALERARPLLGRRRRRSRTGRYSENRFFFSANSRAVLLRLLDEASEAVHAPEHGRALGGARRRPPRAEQHRRCPRTMIGIPMSAAAG